MAVNTHPVTTERNTEPAHVWIVYDGRAESGETGDAAILEACGNGWRELRDALWTWRAHDAVLAEYDSDGTNLTNERIIGHMREGRKALLAKCTRSSHDRT